ncbi:predicted protein [Uncinocarpus reesii 1704]|uniref:Phytocyanin domain-containing protein n=1 Tax=Uncinocarpus reesii (strain UAMH 1704) TaxID=336963 RepID=C4JT37_UNCRE|nr:uncharacterized protein UREG_05626 [Uncinocarpus reesii 1704]EEP80784.1 predicted protein [Uncinocarpus reesii 1704]
MTRLLPLLSLVAAAVASSHEGMGGEGMVGGGSSLPFNLPTGNESQLSAGGQVGGEVQLGGGGQQGQHGSEIQLGGGQHLQPGHSGNGGKGIVRGGGGSNVITVTIITTNNGGGANTEVWNKPPMQQGTIHQVTVGGDAGLVFTPETLNPAIGDMIHFNFQSQNHTVTQSTFDSPCALMPGGLDSGFMPNPNNTVNPPPTMMFQVTTTEPIWMYCKQGPHCVRGMVFSLNPTAEKSHEEFKRKAMESGGEGGAAPPPPPPEAPPVEPPVIGETPTSSVEIPIGTGVPGIGEIPIGGEGGQGNQGGQVVPGSGNMGDGACSCSCLCGASEFPPGAGLGSTGGFGGSIPMAPARKRAVLFWY